MPGKPFIIRSRIIRPARWSLSTWQAFVLRAKNTGKYEDMEE
jgi:hypothetical protein